jgi:hypothetical protein
LMPPASRSPLVRARRTPTATRIFKTVKFAGPSPNTALRPVYAAPSNKGIAARCLGSVRSSTLVASVNATVIAFNLRNRLEADRRVLVMQLGVPTFATAQRAACRGRLSREHGLLRKKPVLWRPSWHQREGDEDPVNCLCQSSNTSKQKTSLP